MIIKSFNQFKGVKVFEKNELKNPSMLKENVTIDISGSDGNAFALIGYAKKFAKQLDMDFRPIKDEMMSGDYDNLLRVLLLAPPATIALAPEEALVAEDFAASFKASSAISN